MIVSCERCHARYKLDDAKIKGRGAKITCPRCRHVFVVYTGNEGVEASTDTATGSSAPATEPGPKGQETPPPAEDTSPGAPRSAEDLDFRKVGIPSWKVKVKIGLVYDFSDISTLKKYIQDKRVTQEDVISPDGSEWVRIGDIPDLDQYFVQVYEQRERQLSGGGDSDSTDEEEFDDGPTMIVGMGSLGANLSTGVFEKKPAPDEPPLPSTMHLEPGDAPPAESAPQAPEGMQFTDPFDALKARKKQQRDATGSQGGNGRPASASRQARGNGKGKGKGTGRGKATGSQGKRDSSAPSRRGLVTAVSLGVVAVGVGIYLYSRFGVAEPRTTTPSTDPVTNTASSPKDGQAREKMREAMLARLEAELEVTDPAEVLDPVEEMDDQQLRPVIPSQATGSSPSTGTTGTDGGSSGAPAVADGSISQAPSTARDYYKAGNAMAQAGDWAGAATAFRKAVDRGGTDPAYQYRLGQALYRTGSTVEAQRVLKEASGAGSSDALKVLGHILRDQGDVSGAISYYREYLQIHPADQQVAAEIDRLTGG